VAPVLNSHGKIQFNRKDKISLCSSGSGSFLKSLGRDGILEMMSSNGIEYLNVVGTTDLNTPTADPEYLGFLDQMQGKDMLVHAYRRESVHINHPTILENSSGRLGLFYPEESLEASKNNNALFPKYGLNDTNILVRLKFVQHCLRT
jgi:UDP-N-acetylglucosamine pyrophosphorylase